MKTTILHDRTIIENKPNQLFLDMLKKEVKNPFSLMALKSDIKVGIELEFFIPVENKSINENMDKLNEKVEHLLGGLSFFNDKIEVIHDSYELDKDLSTSYLEKDSTLNSSFGEGFEFVSPKMDLKDVPFFLKTASEAINDIGYASEDCGLHFHISSDKLKDVDMAKLMTFLHSNDGLFDEYIDRNSYAKSLERVFLNSKIENFNEDIKEQTKQFDLVYLDNNHIELRIFGGADIYENTNEILGKLDTFLDIYRVACTPELENDLYKQLVQENLENGHHQLEPATLESLMAMTKEIQTENSCGLGEAFEEAFIKSEYIQIVPQSLIEEFNEENNLETIPTI